MSLDSETIELVRNEAHLTEELAPESDDGYTITGIAIGENDVTRGESGIEKRWPREALKPSADSLAGRPLVKDHDNTTDGVVGEVTSTAYEDGVGLLYEAELYDESLADKIANGLLEVSIRGYHNNVEDMSEDDDGNKIVEKVVFDNLSIVPTGAAPSNTVEVGESQSVSAATCAEILTEDDDGESQDSQSTLVEDDNSQNTDIDMTEEETEDTGEIEELRETIEELEAENESLRGEVETIRMEYAEDLAEESPFTAEQLADKFTVDELSEKADEIETTELDESEPVPQAGDADEEELSTSDEEDEELEAEIAELEAKADEYERLGMAGALESTRSRIEELRN